VITVPSHDVLPTPSVPIFHAPVSIHHIPFSHPAGVLCSRRRVPGVDKRKAAGHGSRWNDTSKRPLHWIRLDLPWSGSHSCTALTGLEHGADPTWPVCPFGLCLGTVSGNVPTKDALTAEDLASRTISNVFDAEWLSVCYTSCKRQGFHPIHPVHSFQPTDLAVVWYGT
jgi:hypothetical protein